MGRQINFYLERQDEQVLLNTELLSHVESIKCYVSKPRSEHYTDFESDPYAKGIYPQLYICLKRDFDNIVYEKLEAKNLYYVDSTRSQVIEFIRSGYKREENLLISGRFWMEMKYWDKDIKGNPVIITKRKELEELYSSLARWIRKYCTKLPNGNYIGRHAMELYGKGVKLSP